MTKHDPHPGAAKKWMRLATGLATMGVVTLGCGAAVFATGSTANAEPPGGKVGVCHRTASESNPYVFISVPKDEANGHITGTDKQHNHQVTWATDGTWRGMAHKAGDLRLDYYASAEEVAAGRCFNTTEPTTEPTTPPTEPTTPPTEPTTPPTEPTTPPTEPTTPPTEPTTPPTEPTTPPTEPTTPPTEEPTDEPTTPPTDEPSDEPGTDPSTDPKISGEDESRGPDDSGGSDDSNDGTKSKSKDEVRAHGVPRAVDAGVSDSASRWGSGLMGGGTALVLSSGGVLLGVRRFEG
ncbi:hypothetical protein [Aeromicrobium duanguangcaii]|uniref:PT repeat-containing protein n=1 Tax=Aeromicrobium duanguangcaii TaxID=2968086 RepID=A0ABY5KFE2_9ACTN|nr:hypothetical protein [Aeromicrobium duanguangcaii]MCD9154449.1 hypothetical protein [Aeromicrobium duanguangcaii]UUI68493.1 hypothetical protein NP095_14980 [Aeromicrobium duanguangcaii]